MKKANHPNMSVMFYDVEADFVYECPGRCKMMRTYTEPAEEGEDCAFLRPGQSCGHMPARLAALKALRERIDAEIKEAGEEDGGAA